MRQPRLSIARRIDGTDELTIVSATGIVTGGASDVATASIAADGTRDVETSAEGHRADRDIVAVVRSRSIAESASATAAAASLLRTPRY